MEVGFCKVSTLILWWVISGCGVSDPDFDWEDLKTEEGYT